MVSVGGSAIREDASHWDAFTGRPWLPENGFEWSSSLVAETPSPLHLGPWLIPRPHKRVMRDTPRSPSFVRNSPLRVSNLHRRFAALALSEPSPDGILGFANQYGFLGHPIRLHDSTIAKNGTTQRRIDQIIERARARPTGPSSIRKLTPSSLRKLNQLLDADPYINRSHVEGESFTYWANESYEMLVLTRLWDALNLKAGSHLRKYVSWERAWSVTIDLGSFAHDELNAASIGLWSTNEKKLLDAWKAPNSDEVIDPIRYYILERINSRLSHIAPRLVSSTKNLIHRVAASWSSEVTMIPDCLLSALYLNFALEVSAESRPTSLPPRKCRGCDGWIKNPSRRDQIYHPECRAREKKRRQRAAKENRD